MDLEAKVKEVTQRTISLLSEKRNGKYEGVLRGLSLAPQVFFFDSFSVREATIRAELLKTFYVAMRVVDDFVDLDVPLPASYGAYGGVEYVNERLDFLSKGVPADDVDYLLLRCRYLGDELGISVEFEAESILRSMLFDAVRIKEGKAGRTQVYSASELTYHFHQLDVEGTIRGMLKLFNEDPDKAGLLLPIGNAHRLKMTLQDLTADVSSYLINISSEDLDGYSITSHDLELVASLPKKFDLAKRRNELPFGVRLWCTNQAATGLQYIKEQKALLREHEFRKLGKLVLKVAYLYPTEWYFAKVLYG